MSSFSRHNLYQYIHSCTYGVRKDFHHGRFGFLENRPNVGRIAVGGSFLGVGVNPKGLTAASLTTGIALGTTIDANPTTAGGWIDDVQACLVAVGNRKGGDAPVAVFLDGSQRLSSRREGSRLVAAALARTSGTLARTINRQNLSFRVVFFDDHGVPVRMMGVSEESCT